MTHPAARDPLENPLLDAQLLEAREVQVFLNSPAYTWLKSRLERLRPALLAKATTTGVKRDDRMLLLGQLALVEGLLARPGMLSELAKRQDAAAMDVPSIIEPPQIAPQRYTPGKL